MDRRLDHSGGLDQPIILSVKVQSSYSFFVVPGQTLQHFVVFESQLMQPEKLVFKGPVRSGYCVLRDLTETETG
jgi:hypothetical protein